MEFDPNFRQQFPYLSGLFPENPCLKPEIPTMASFETSTLPPPPPAPQNNPLLYHTNFHHFLEHHPAFLVEGSSSINPFSGIPTPSSSDPFEAAHANGSLQRDFVNAPHPMPFAPNNKMDALHGYHSGKSLWEFSQKVPVQSVAPAQPQIMGPSPSPSLVYGGECGLVPMKPKLENELSSITSTDHRGDDERKLQKRVQMQKHRKFQQNITNIIKGQWTPEEDRLLVDLVKRYGLKKWSQIAKLLSGRVGKQCRERWHNHLRPDIRKDSWTEEEDRILIAVHKEVGNKWAEIARRLPGRTENTIKNHWNATKRRQNSKKLKNRPTPSKGSLLLQAYIKRVTAAEAAARELKKSLSKMKMISEEDCDDDLALQVHYESSEDDFSSEDWASEVYGKEDVAMRSLQHHMFLGNGGYAPMQVNSEETAMEMQSLAREDQMKKEMDLIEMIYGKY